MEQWPDFVYVINTDYYQPSVRSGQSLFTKIVIVVKMAYQNVPLQHPL